MNESVNQIIFGSHVKQSSKYILQDSLPSALDINQSFIFLCLSPHSTSPPQFSAFVFVAGGTGGWVMFERTLIQGQSCKEARKAILLSFLPAFLMQALCVKIIQKHIRCMCRIKAQKKIHYNVNINLFQSHGIIGDFNFQCCAFWYFLNYR